MIAAEGTSTIIPILIFGSKGLFCFFNSFFTSLISFFIILTSVMPEIIGNIIFIFPYALARSIARS